MKWKSNLINSFAAGVLLATSVSGIVYFSTKGDASNVNASANNNKSESVDENAVNTPTVEEMKEILTNSGYIVQSNEEAGNAEAPADQEQPAENQEAEQPQEEQQPEVKKVTITVSEGMTSYDVGSTLNSEQIIPESAFEFSQKVEQQGVANYLKLGSYEISSDMTTDQIISTIFKKQS